MKTNLLNARNFRTALEFVLGNKFKSLKLKHSLLKLYLSLEQTSALSEAIRTDLLAQFNLQENPSQENADNFLKEFTKSHLEMEVDIDPMKSEFLDLLLEEDFDIPTNYLIAIDLVVNNDKNPEGNS